MMTFTGKKKHKRTRSIAFLLVVGVICVLVPLNLWFIYSAYQTQGVVLDNAYNSIENIGAIRMDDLSQRIHSINNYCYDLMNDNGAIFEINQLVKVSALSSRSREHISNYEDGDAFFFYYPKYEAGFKSYLLL